MSVLSSISLRHLSFTSIVVLLTGVIMAAIFYVSAEHEEKRAQERSIADATSRISEALQGRPLELAESVSAVASSVCAKGNEYAVFVREPKGAGWRMVVANAADGVDLAIDLEMGQALHEAKLGQISLTVREETPEAPVRVMEGSVLASPLPAPQLPEAGSFRRITGAAPIFSGETDDSGLKPLVGVVAVREDFPVRFAAWNTLANRVILGILIALALAMGTGWLFIKGMSRDIRALVEGMDQVTRGRYEYRIKVTRQDEIGLAQGGFNLLAECLERARVKDREAMRQLMATKMESETAMLAKSDFLANMSHEIRTPMNGIIGTTSLVLETPLTTQQRDMLKIIRASGQSLLHIINDVLDYSKLETSKMVLDETPVNLRPLFDEIGEMFAPTMAERNLELSLRVGSEIPMSIYTDRERLKQILVNLVGNAAKFTERGEIQVRAVALNPGSVSQRIQIEVEDTGIGIPADKLGTIFEAFQQADVTTTRKYGGSGLGLSIGRKLSALLNGDLQVRSEVGKGSVFTLEFPYRTVPEHSEIPERARLMAELAGRRIAIIAQASAAELMTSYLKDWGSQSMAVAGLSAVEMQEIAQFEPELLVIETCWHPRDLLEYFFGRLMEARFPIVAVSRLGESLGHLASHGDLLKWVTKPVKEMDLIHRIADGLNGRSGSEVAASPGDVGAEGETFAGKFPGRLLLVEDQPMNQKIVSMMLQKLGYEVSIAENGRDAVELVNQDGRFDLILMDLQMPVMGGVDASKEIRRNFLLPKQPFIVALTGHALTGVREDCRKAGMNHFMTKPVSLDDLRHCMQEFLGGSGKKAA